MDRTARHVNKNLLRLDAKEVEEARRIWKKQIARDGHRQPAIQGGLAGAPKSKYSPKRDQFTPILV